MGQNGKAFLEQIVHTKGRGQRVAADVDVVRLIDWVLHINNNITGKEFLNEIV